MDEIGIQDLCVRTLVGFSTHELGKLQELKISIHMMLPPLKKAGTTDEVKDTVNYKTVTKAVLTHVQNKQYNLIESVATDVARICVARYDIPLVKVIIEKPNSLRFAKSSTLTMARRLEDFDFQEVYVSIGSNVNPLENIPRAIDLLAKKVQVARLSKAFLTTPEKCDNQPDFVNMAVLIRTKLGPEGLKLFLLEIEKQLGRTRDPANKNAARTIDLDISFWEDKVLEYKLVDDGSTKSWRIPEPDTMKYAHVIIPLADISPQFVHPVQKQTLSKMAEQITGKISYLSFYPTVCIQSQCRECFESNERETMNGTSAYVNPNPQESCVPVALITGASQRLGAVIARRLHNVGYNIVVHYNLSELQASELVTDFNRVRINSANSLQVDLKNDIQNTAENLISKAKAMWGRLDVLVNNASIFHSTVVGSTNEKMWNNLMQTNLTAPFFLSQAAYPALKTSRGCIVNLIDIHGVRPLTNHSVYCISKAGLQMCTLAMSKDFAPHVRVNGVAPGAILWPSKSALTKEDSKKKKEILDKIPMGKTGSPEDVASAVEYLVCHADYVTGHVINVDGGRVLNQ